MIVISIGTAITLAIFCVTFFAATVIAFEFDMLNNRYGAKIEGLTLAFLLYVVLCGLPTGLSAAITYLWS